MTNILLFNVVILFVNLHDYYWIKIETTNLSNDESIILLIEGWTFERVKIKNDNN